MENMREIIKIFTISILVLVTGFISTGKTAAKENTSGGFEFNTNRRSIRIPARISNNLVVIPIRINDSPPLNFILDTGVNTTILIEPMIARVFDLPIDEVVYVLGLGNEGVVEAGMSKGLTFTMRGITGKNMNLIIIPDGILSFSEYFGFPVHGIIGNDLFKEFPVRVNYRTNTVRIYRNPTYRVRRNSQEIPLEMDNNKPYVWVNVEGDEKGKTDSLRLLVDMGATNPVFLNHSFKYLTEDRIPSFLGKGISGELEGEMGRLRKLEIGEFKLDEPLVAYPQYDFLAAASFSFEWEGILGAGILSRFHVILDYPSQKLILRKNRNFGNEFHSNLSGMDIIAEGIRFNEYKVSHVRKNSAAWEEGILPGDRIVSINRDSVSQMKIDDIMGLFNQSPGTIIQMQIIRDEMVLSKTFRLREDI
jgi:hypothetical protein